MDWYNDWSFLDLTALSNNQKEEIKTKLEFIFKDIKDKRYIVAIMGINKINKIVINFLFNKYNLEFDKSLSDEELIRILKDKGKELNDKKLLTMVHNYLFSIKNTRNIYEYKQEFTFIKDGKNDCISTLDKLYRLLQLLKNDDDEIKELNISKYFDLKTIEEVNVIPSQTNIEKNNRDFLIEKRSIRDWLIAKNEKLIIPIYQRKYTWNEYHLESLLNDIKKRQNDGKDHYFGNIAAKKINNEIKIIDGQQRLTTSLIFICVIRDLLICQGEDREMIYNEIFSNLNFLNHPTGQLKEDLIFEEIKDLKFVYENEESTSSNIFKKNYNYLKKEIDNLTNGANKKHNIYKFADTYLNQFQLSTISFDGEIYNNKLEFEIFDNLNSKGKPLTSFELIRNYILNLCESHVYDDYKNSTKIRSIFHQYIDEKVKDDKDDKDAIKFFSIFSLYMKKDGKELSQARGDLGIFDAFKDNYSNYFNINKDLTIEELEDNIKKISSYLEIFEFICNDLEQRSYFINKYLDFIKVIVKNNRIRVKRELFLPLTFLIYEVTNFNSQNLNDNYVLSYNDQENIKKSFKQILYFIVKTSVITIQGDSEIKKYVYETIAKLRQLLKNNNDIISSKLKFISNYLEQNFTKDNQYVERKWSFNIFKNNLEINDMSNELGLTILKIIEDHLLNIDKTKESIQRLSLSLEHIMPQDNKDWWKEYSSKDNSKPKEEWEEEYDLHTSKLGNMLILSKSLNSSIKNSIFSKKKEIYKNLAGPLYKNENEDIDISNKKYWDKDLINKRTKCLAKILYENIITK